MARVGTITIRTPEGISFPLIVAGPLTRFMAWLVDFFCVAVGILGIAAVLDAFEIVLPDIAGAMDMIVFFAITIGYGIAFEWLYDGRTIGKRLFRLRVMDVSGLKLGFNQVVLRNLLRPIDSFPVFYLAGGIAALLSPRGQRLGDLAANTIVVRDAPAAEPDLHEITQGRYNSFRDHPHLVARLRRKVEPPLAGAALAAIVRRDELEDTARVAVFRELASALREAVEFPESVAFGLSDEQYVRNGVDVLFRAEERAAYLSLHK